jgi:uncharacterized membrane protein
MVRQAPLILIALAIGHVSALRAHCQPPFFMGLGDLPGGGFFSYPDDISADGAVIVGASSVIGAPTYRNDAFRWTRETGMVSFGAPSRGIERVSADASTVVLGRSPNRWYYWTTADGLVEVDSDFHPAGVSGDGSVFVGTVPTTPPDWAAARWTEAGDVELLPIATKDVLSAHDVAADGSVILILERLSNNAPWRLSTWSAVEGTTAIDLPAEWSSDPEFLKLADNGKVVVSSIGLGADRRGFRWTKETGAVDVGRLPDGLWMSANGVSADGSIIVGNSQNSIPQRPAIWDAVHGPRYLDDVLISELKLDDALAGWTQLIAHGVSGDGRSVFGRGTNPDGNTEGWIAYLGPPGVAGDFNSDGIVDAADYIVWRNGLGTTYTQAGYDVWRANFGRTAAGAAAVADSISGSRASNIPEPTCWILFVVALVTLSTRVRKTLPR